MSETTTGTATPSVLAVTWPHKFLPAVPAGGKKSFPPPCGGNPVDRAELAGLVVMLNLAAMEAAGELTLEASTSKKFFMTFNDVKLKLNGSPQAGGIKGALVKQISRSSNLRSVVRQWLDKEFRNPFNEVIGRGVLEAIDLGIYAWVDANRNFVTAAFKGSKTIHFDCDKVAGLEPEADRLAAVWRQFAGSQNFGIVRDATKEAIEAQRQRAGGDGDDIW